MAADRSGSQQIPEIGTLRCWVGREIFQRPAVFALFRPSEAAVRAALARRRPHPTPALFCALLTRTIGAESAWACPRRRRSFSEGAVYRADLLLRRRSL